MDDINSKKTKNILLSQTGLLSNSSTDLRTWLALNSIKTVDQLLKFMDDPSSLKVFLYHDTLTELRGLTDILKQKYFNIPFITDIYFDKPIKYISFDVLGSPLWTYGIQSRNDKKIDIYVLINRLGFNDKERGQILNVSEDYLDGILLIDLLNDAYNRIIKKIDFNEEDQILCNKILVILNYYLIKFKHDKDSDFMKSVYDSILELNDVLARKYALELQEKKLQNKNLSDKRKK